MHIWPNNDGDFSFESTHVTLQKKGQQITSHHMSKVHLVQQVDNLLNQKIDDPIP